ncbi:fatty-acid amide hydrolase 2 isoform X2 [Lycorma delicatula]|uniref:fatty-acid amide hydrolase 2 isoform X2 n=1 Tax=Lycorma delicatula TaxID=130591 RepID=UPI003F50FC04
MSSKNRRKNSRSKKSIRKMACNLLITVLVYFRFAYDWLIDFIISKILYDDTKKTALPSVKSNIITENAVSLAEKIRTKELSSETVLKTFIEQIKAVNPFLNSLVEERFEFALNEAREVDKYLSSTSLSIEELKTEKPFLGVPFTCKESVAAKGMNFSLGLLSRKDIKATEDADIVEKVKASGAILLGMTNIPEINLWVESRNNVYGQTNNPYNLNRIVGGSSGGEACLLAACGTPLGLGTDIGGSIRMPAFYCGVFGHKPTAGLMSNRGVSFRTGNEKGTMVTGGPMTKYCVDIIPLLKIMLGNSSNFLQLDAQVDLRTLNVMYVDEPGDILVSPVSEEIKNTIKRAVNHLNSITQNSGQKVSFSGFRHCFKLWKHAMTKETDNFAFDLSNREKEVTLWTEVPRLLTGCTQFTLPPLLRLVDLNVFKPVNKNWAEEKTKELKNELLEVLGDNGILLFPSAPESAPYHYAPFFRPYNFAYWAIFNVLKFPVTQVPLGLDKRNLPIGVQVVAAPYKDHLCIAVARELEKAFGGWVSPFSSDMK